MSAVASVLSRPLPYVRDGLCAVPSFLPPEDFAQVREDCRRLRGQRKREKDAFAVGRTGCYVPRRSGVHLLLASPAVRARIARLVGQALEPSAYPLELRSYGVGAEMGWHRDDLLFAKPQCELVLCLDNDTDSQTEWIDAEGEHHALWTAPNTALLVRAGDTGAAHRVTPLRRGERTILKMVWTVPGAAPLPAFFDHLDSLPGLRKSARRGAGAGRTRRR